MNAAWLATSLAFGVGTLFGIGVTDTNKQVQPLTPQAVEIREIAEPRAKRDDETCMYVRPDSQTFTMTVPSGVTCLTVLAR